LAAEYQYGCAASGTAESHNDQQAPHAVRESKFETFREFADIVNQQNRDLQMLRGMFEFKPAGTARITRRKSRPASE